MSSLPSSVCPTFIVVGHAVDFRRTADAGIAVLAPGARIEKADSLEAAAAMSGNVVETVIVLLQPAAESVVAAMERVDVDGLPRWAVVVFGEVAAPAEVVVVPRVDEEPRFVARAFQLALAMQRLRCENGRCRGDLATIGTRVAHDLRSPLGGVLTTVEVLKEGLAENAPEQIALLEPILDSADGLTKLIRQVSVITKASGGANPRQRLDMGLAFWAALQRVEREVAARGATVLQPAAWPEVEGDQGWLEVMWHALLSNSLRYGGPAPRLEAGWAERAGENRFWVIDSGEVPAAKRAALFTPFHLLHQPNAPRGLGLPIVRRLAELQGGKSGYEPTPGGGSCFYFTLPVGPNGGTI